MAKVLKTIIKLQIPAGQANPAPPVGPALGQHGINVLSTEIEGPIGDPHNPESL